MLRKILILALLFILHSGIRGQWREVQLDEGDMAADLAEALTFTKYPTYFQYVEMMQGFARDYPEICRVDTFGITPHGRLLLAVKISDSVSLDEAEVSFLYTSSMHGDELVGYPLMLRLIDYLLSGYGSDEEVTRLVDGLAIWINPLANPDGTYYPDDNLSVINSQRGTADGTDLNRDFPDSEAGDALNDTAGRAVETRAMMAFLQEHRFNMSANIHSGAEVVNYPWDHTYELHADDDWFRFVSREYADEAKAVDPGYMALFEDGITNGARWYRVNGGRQDYVNAFLEGREITLELSNDYRLDSDLLDEYWGKNERSLLNFLAQGLYGIRGRVQDAVSGLPLEARIEIPLHDQPYSWVHSRALHGDFYRLVEEGSHELVVSAAGHFSDTIPLVGIENYRATYLDINLEPWPLSDKSTRVFTFHMYPNPSGGQCLIVPDIQEGDQVQISAFDSKGVLVHKKNLPFNGQGYILNTSGWETGVYFIRCSTARASLIRKLIVL